MNISLFCIKFNIKMENITVNIRIRPKQLEEVDNSNNLNSSNWKIEGNSIINMKSKDIFSYDNVFTPETLNIDIFNESIKDNLNMIFQGINVSIFAYGQTCTGKTYTMRGQDYSPGIIPLSLNFIFSKLIEKNDSKDFKVTEMKVSYLEIYNESVNDLLDTSKKNLEIREGKKGIYVENLTEIRVDTPEIAFNLVKQGDSNKIIAETKLNDKSSRSHCIFKISLELTDDKGKKYISCLNLIDLAGSENATKTKTEGVRFQEGSNINKSLLALSNVIQKLSSSQLTKTTKAVHVCYRDSKLTRFLQPSLSGNSKTIIICTISSGSNNYSETLNTLLFASRAKNIKTNTKVNEIVDDKDKIFIENNELRNRIKRLEEKLFTSTKKKLSTERITSTIRQSSAKKTSSNIIKKLNIKEFSMDNDEEDKIAKMEKEVEMMKNLLTAQKEEFQKPLVSNKKNLFPQETCTPGKSLSMNPWASINQNTSSNFLDFNNFASPYISKYSNMYSAGVTNSKYYNNFNNHNSNNYMMNMQNLNQLMEVDENSSLSQQNKDLKNHFMEVIEKKNSIIKSITENSEKIRRDLEENYLKIRLENERIKEELSVKESDLRDILAKLNSSEKQVIFLKDELFSLKSKEISKNSNNELKILEDKIKYLENEISTQKENFMLMEKENNVLKDKNFKLLKHNEILTSENFTLKTQNDMSSKNVESLKYENNQLKNNIDSYKSEITLMQQKIVQKKNEVNQMKAEHEKIIKKNFSLEYETKIKELNKEKKDIEVKLQEKEDKLIELIRFTEDQNKKIDSLQNEEKFLKNKVETLEKFIKQISEKQNDTVTKDIQLSLVECQFKLPICAEASEIVQGGKSAKAKKTSSRNKSSTCSKTLTVGDLEVEGKCIQGFSLFDQSKDLLNSNSNTHSDLVEFLNKKRQKKKKEICC